MNTQENGQEGAPLDQEAGITAARADVVAALEGNVVSVEEMRKHMQDKIEKERGAREIGKIYSFINDKSDPSMVNVITGWQSAGKPSGAVRLQTFMNKKEEPSLRVVGTIGEVKDLREGQVWLAREDAVPSPLRNYLMRNGLIAQSNRGAKKNLKK